MALELKHFTPEQAAEIMLIVEEAGRQAHQRLIQRELRDPNSWRSKRQRATPEKIAEFDQIMGRSYSQ